MPIGIKPILSTWLAGLAVRRFAGCRLWAVSLLVAGAVAISGCATMAPVGEPLQASASFGALQLFQDTQSPLLLPDKATISGDQVLPKTSKRDHDVLVLSGGGSHGAFGAGMMVGWTASGKRPEFEIVTGVSTGALIATFAFLGPQWDGKLQQFYTNISNDQIYIDRGIGGFFEESLYDTAPLKSLIDKVVDERMLEAVAAEHGKGRRLYVATTDLDAGQVVVWDMGGIAASDHPTRLELYRRILLSSSALPGLFEPVYIPGKDGQAHMHVDGGVKAPILLRSFMVGSQKARRTVYVLVNGKLSLTSEAPPVVANFKNISLRSISELMRGLFYKTIYQGYVTTRNAGGKFRIAYLPDEVPTGNALEFHKKEMRQLFQVGYRMGLDPKSWAKEPPRLEPLERVKEAKR